MSETANVSGSEPARNGTFELSPNSYIASRLKHATPEHLHLTSRRFFIGPIPEGWLNSNRKTWYKRKLELINHPSRQATFTASDRHGTHQRTISGLQQPSIAARMQFSFPQPQDALDDEPTDGDQSEEDVEPEDDSDEEIETTALAPVSTADAPRLLNTADENDIVQSNPGASSSKRNISNAEGDDLRPSITNKSRVESFVTAREEQKPPETPVSTKRDDERMLQDDGNRNSMSTRGLGTSLRPSGSLDVTPADNMDNSSKTALLRADTPNDSPTQDQSKPKTMVKHSPAPIQSSGMDKKNAQKGQGVRFKVAEGVVDRQRRIGKRVDSARLRVSHKIARKAALKEGTIVKMERMLVRIDVTAQQIPDEFDENESVKTETQQMEKWTEFMVVARKSNNEDDDDFRLQFYKTRAIPEIENQSTKKKPAREVRLLPKTTHVNLFSSLDKTVVIWHPFRKGTRIFILRPSSSAHSVEWYTFLRDALGWHRSTTIQVNVPDLDVALHLENPFDELETAGIGAEDEVTALSRTLEAEKAVAGRIVSQSMDMLRKDPEWTQVLQTWTEGARMGLAWKRYDRLEWIHGVNEQKMFGSMAMQQSYDLELRPKHHYPTHISSKKGQHQDEPAPVEGFLIRLTTQKGVQKKLGRAYFKRLYFSTYDQYLVFNRPAKATPPHPPRLATISGSNVPSSAEIVENTPTMFDVEPFPVENGKLKHLKAAESHAVRVHDLEAAEEARRTLENLIASDGYVDMRHITNVRRLKWGASDADEFLDSGSDVDFHTDVDNTTREDGTTNEIDDDRIFEIVLENKLVVRLQAYNKQTRDEWMGRLRRLVKYWKARTSADMTNLKAVRQSNLQQLNIDEEQEARIGQFAHKWEVSRSDASPDLYNMCRLASCRTLTMSGSLYRKHRKHATFHRCGVLLTHGQMLIYQDTLRKGTGEQVPHAHHEKQQVVDLRDCYVYSGLIVEEDLLYQNRTFDANHAGMLAATPRIYLDDGWTSADVDVMTCFVVWMNRRKGWFRSVVSEGGDTATHTGGEPKEDSKGGTRSKLKRVTQLGVPGRGMVFKCRSRAERDLWVLAVTAEIDAAVEKEMREQGNVGEGLAEVRLEH